MPTSALILLFVSAILHTTWNLLLKQANDKFISTWWAVLAGSVVFLPVLFFNRSACPSDVDPSCRQRMCRNNLLRLVVICLPGFGFFTGLSHGSRRCTSVDCIMVHPFFGRDADSRGIGRADHCHPGSYHRRSSGLLITREKPHPKGIILALAIALLISIYSVIDGAAVKQTSAFPYAILVFFLAPVITSPLLIRRYGWERITVYLENKSKKAIRNWIIDSHCISSYAYRLFDRSHQLFRRDQGSQCGVGCIRRLEIPG